MKKLLLAASIVALSAPAMASSIQLDNEKEATLKVIAHYVEPLTVELAFTVIDFGDVYTDSEVGTVPVLTELAGEPLEEYSYKISSDGDYATLENKSGTGAFGVDGKGEFYFVVGLDTKDLTEDQNVSETVTVSVTYSAIATTTTTKS